MIEVEADLKREIKEQKEEEVFLVIVTHLVKKVVQVDHEKIILFYFNIKIYKINKNSIKF